MSKLTLSCALVAASLLFTANPAAAAKGPSAKEVREAYRGVTSLATAPADLRDPMVVAICYTSKTCAGTCKKPMRAYANSRKAASLLKCKPFAAVAGKSQGKELESKAKAWLKKHVGAYFDQVAPLLKKDFERKYFAAERKKLGW